MGYGQESNDAVYQDENDYFVDSSSQEQKQTQEQPAPQQVDYAAQYNELKQQFDALQPQLGMLNRLQTAINPEPQIDPQQKAVNDFIAAQATQALNPQLEAVQKQYEEMVLTQVDDWAASKGFNDGQEALDWLMVVQHPIKAEAMKGNAQATQLLQNIVQLNNSANWLGLQRYVEKNWNAINQFSGNYARKAPVQAQQFGQSYGNNSFTQTQQSFAQLQQQAQEYRHTNPEKYAEVLQQMKQIALGG